MEYVKKHLRKHILLGAPHRWFIALLISPVHILELHYQKRYHLRFAHARKLFLFDMILLSSIFIIAGAGIFWFVYDPTVQDNVSISISTNAHRIDEDDAGHVKSGEHIFFYAEYKNNSLVLLDDPIVYANLPPGFLLFNVKGGAYLTSTKSIAIPEIKPKEGGQIIFEGQFIGEPDHEYPAGIELIYRQKNRNLFEVVTGSVITTLRGSVLAASVTAPSAIFEESAWESQLVIKNSNHHNVSNISVPFISNTNTTYAVKETTLGKIEKNKWHIPLLAAGETATTTFGVSVRIPKKSQNFALELIPGIAVNGTIFNQEKLTAHSVVVFPELRISGHSQNIFASPGETAETIITLQNTGTIELANTVLTIPLPSGIVSVSAAKQKNNASLVGSSLVFSSKNIPELAKLKPGAIAEIPLSIPIIKFPIGSNDITLILNPKVNAEVSGIKERFTTDQKLDALKIGTALKINSSARFYSPEGDQIGRGPLPPRIGKETKYWALLEIENNTSAVSGIVLSAKLPSYVEWTGKTSVSSGNEPAYSPTTKTITWRTAKMSPHETAHVNFELAVTPEQNQKGTAPMLLRDIQISGFDTFIEKDISAVGAHIDISLPNDDIAQKKGVMVQ